MEDKIKFLDRAAYDELCDQVRHVVTDMKAYDDLTEKVTAVIFDLAESLKTKRKELVSRVQRLERLIDNVLKVPNDG